MEKHFTLDSIRIGTEHALPDAIALANRILVRDRSSMDHTTFEYSRDFFVAVVLEIACSKKSPGTIDNIIQFIDDAAWDSRKQMICQLVNRLRDISNRNDTAGRWADGFRRKFMTTPEESADILIGRIRLHWLTMAGLSSNGIRIEDRPKDALRIFGMDSIANALELVASMKDERRGGSDRPLRNALIDDGYRRIPDTISASLQLASARGEFENLAEPIDRLSNDLVLAGAMKPEDFGITPILLLGDPGIGKTYLATQLAKALDVPCNKISAGGAQGGFQLTGSHNSWTGARPGSIFTLLADGDSASPLVIIDEVDKIRDGQYPVLPVLLDLLEPRTARKYKDEFYEIEFDASRMIIVMTANDIASIPLPMLSRMEIFKIPRPEPVQRLRIVHKEAEALRLATNRTIDLDDRECTLLASRDDIDLRKLTRVVKDAFANAIRRDEPVARLSIPKREGRQPIGFSTTMG